MIYSFGCRRWIECALLVSLDVLPSWYREHRNVIFLLIGTCLIIAGILESKFSYGTPRDVTFSILYAGIFIFRRVLNGLARRKWIQILLSRQVVHGRERKSFLSSPANGREMAEMIVDGGPLGPGCAKLLDVCIGLAFLSTLQFLSFPDQLPSWTSFCSIGSLWPNWWLPACVMMLSFTVNGVLWIWSSSLEKSRGAHEGVHRMVKGTISRSLTTPEHMMLLAWSLVNALCEEMSSRGFNRWEFAILQGATSSIGKSDVLQDPSNIWQAASFGFVHFYGVPSGWSGVLLTFLYGWLLGVLHDAGGGLLYPILTHTVADYFIFSQIARRQ